MNAYNGFCSNPQIVPMFVSLVAIYHVPLIVLSVRYKLHFSVFFRWFFIRIVSHFFKIVTKSLQKMKSETLITEQLLLFIV